MSRLLEFLALRALVSIVLVLAPTGLVRAGDFQNGDVQGRYVSAETAYDISSVHDAAADPGNIGPPIWFAATAVMVADGQGNVCGEADGFYSLGTAGQIPGTNTGPAFFHGTYNVSPTDGRITIDTCGDTGPFCSVSTPCSPVTKEQVGYISHSDATTITTVEQNISSSFSSGFLVHARVWRKAD